jgi:hypothetical protein
VNVAGDDCVPFPAAFAAWMLTVYTVFGVNPRIEHEVPVLTNVCSDPPAGV